MPDMDKIIAEKAQETDAARESHLQEQLAAAITATGADAATALNRLAADLMNSSVLDVGRYAALAAEAKLCTKTEFLAAVREQRAAAKTSNGDARVITTADYANAIIASGYTLRFNEMSQEVECNGTPLTDHVAAEIHCKLRDRGFSSTPVIDDVLIASSRESRYHPIKEFYDGLTWDGKAHIHHLAQHLTDSAKPFADGRTLAERFLHRWLVGCVAKCFDQAQNSMLVLESAQNLGKSTLARWLASPLPHLFLERQLMPESNDSLIRLMSSWIWEVSELGTTTRRADVEALKSFISLRDVQTRRPYGRRDIRGPAIAGLVGTVNDTGAGFLSDTTGTRRFLTIPLTAISWDYQNYVDVRGLWAEAVADFKTGMSGILDAEEVEERERVNAGFNSIDPVWDVLDARFNVDPTQRDWLTTSAAILEVVDHTLTGTSGMHARSIAAYMKQRHGVTGERTYLPTGTRVRCYRGVICKS